jgi:hypothetical protein
MDTPLKIGIDFGGVLDSETSENTSVMNMPFAVQTLQALKAKGHSLHIISFCGKKKATETLERLKSENLLELFSTIHFTKRRELKKVVCNFLECDVLIDDREDTLKDLITNQTIPILFGKESPEMLSVSDWLSVPKVLETIPKIIQSFPFTPSIDHLCHRV